jgi:hypothetical protein
VECVFQFLNVFFKIAPFLIHVDLSKPFILEMDVFNFALGTILSQFGKSNLLHGLLVCVFVNVFLLK